MRRLLSLCLALAAIGWLEFQFFPGHTYLHSATQIYVPMLERMDAPGYLSRDLVATNPNLSYTIYDEVTLFLHREARLDFQRALEDQQFVFRLAGLIGVFLLARATRLNDAFSLLIAALVNWGASFPGPAVATVDTEPVPMAFACGAALLAAGLLASAKPLLGSLAGAIALLYDPIIAAPFWAIVVLAFSFDRQCRKMLRPILPILLVSVLLLANLAQLQPQMVADQSLFARLSTRAAELQQFRTPYAWFSPWQHDVWQYLALAVFGIWAAARIWPLLNRQTRWLMAGMGFAGIVSVFCSYVLADRARLAIAVALQPSRMLVFTILFTSFACALAAVQAIKRRRHGEALGWFALVTALPLNARIFDFLRIFEAGHGVPFALGLSIAALLTWTARSKRLLPIGLLAAIPALALAVHAGRLSPSDESRKSVTELAGWAEQNTWGGSLFLFPDAGRERYPGVFRARSQRALWVDWKSGMLAASFQPVALEWFDRWQGSMEGGFSRERLERLLPLPIDYYVVKSAHRLPGMPTAFRNQEFYVYDAQDLKYPRRR
jgi:hypothetical protein